MPKQLSIYQKKRNFKKTKEPIGKISKKKGASFVIQKHYARSLHYDLRLEVDGVLKSWAVPKGVPKTSKEKRLAIQTEDHPLEYGSFEGTIPKGEYGAGKVQIWDKGSYQNLKSYKNGKEIPMKTCIKKGRIEVLFSGKRLRGIYALIHFKEKQWLLIKVKKRV